MQYPCIYTTAPRLRNKTFAKPCKILYPVFAFIPRLTAVVGGFQRKKCISDAQTVSAIQGPVNNVLLFGLSIVTILFRLKGV
jgi:hypothetical protein